MTLSTLLALALVSCTGGAEPPDSRPVPSTLPTTSTTISTAFEVSIANAPPGLTTVVESFYRYAAGSSEQRPPAPDTVVASMPRDRVIASGSGAASFGAFQGTPIASVQVGPDVFLAVADGTSWRVVGGYWPSLSVPEYFGPSPRLLAVVGSDARPDESVTSTRADSIHFVGLDGQGGGAVVGLPRDSYVPVPGFGQTKITNSLAVGGPDVMYEAFVELTGLPLEGYVLTGFNGFEELVDSVLGGVQVEVPFPISDSAAKAELAAGLQVLNGFDALAFARARKTIPGGDFTRSSHQGVVLLGAAAGVQEMGHLALPQMLEAAEPHLVTNLTPEQLFTFSAMVVAADLDTIPSIVVPGSVGRAGEASVVFLDEDAAGIWNDLADGRLDG